jgi:LmbE family N-acetylglucosaminyl deacetylase
MNMLKSLWLDKMIEKLKSLRKVKSIIQKAKKIILRRRFWIIAVIITLIISWGGGFFTGWWWSHGRIGSFPVVNANTRLLVVVPHPDDEVLIAGGLIQRVLSASGKVKIVFLTMGDKSIGSVIKIDKSMNLAPTEFLSLGERRHGEALMAANTLGLSEKDLVFLGFPDGGLEEVLARDLSDERGSVISRSTRMDHVPYSWAYKVDQKYFDGELVNDMLDVLKDFNPNLVVTTHPRDLHPDHRAAVELIEKIKLDKGFDWPIYTALVHYRDYPPNGDYIFPPRKLFSDKWESLELYDSEVAKTKEAIKNYASQLSRLDLGWYMKFEVSDEIFEKD